jgi:PilZ domain
METQQGAVTSMTKTPTAASAVPAKSRATERRASRRCKITQLMRIRPSDPEKDHFDDIRGTLSVSRSGVYFQTSEPAYEIGMRLFVTLPYSYDPMSLNREFLAEVVRRDSLPTAMFGIGLKILMEMGMSQPTPTGYEPPRK